MPVHYNYYFVGSVADDLEAVDFVADYIVVDDLVADYIVAVDVVVVVGPEVVPIDDLQLQPQRLFSCEAQLVYL